MYEARPLVCGAAVGNVVQIKLPHALGAVGWPGRAGVRLCVLDPPPYPAAVVARNATSLAAAAAAAAIGGSSMVYVQVGQDTHLGTHGARAAEIGACCDVLTVLC